MSIVPRSSDGFTQPRVPVTLTLLPGALQFIEIFNQNVRRAKLSDISAKIGIGIGTGTGKSLY